MSIVTLTPDELRALVKDAYVEAYRVAAADFGAYGWEPASVFAERYATTAPRIRRMIAAGAFPEEFVQHHGNLALVRSDAPYAKAVERYRGNQ